MAHNVSFDKICRSCLTSNGVREIFVVNGDVEKFKMLSSNYFSQMP